MYFFRIIGIFVFSIMMQEVSFAQSQNIWVYFSDKNATPYTIDNPSAFLSEQAIDRRERMLIPIRKSDLPVDPQYISAIKQTGALVRTESRWLNAVSVTVTGPEMIAEISALSFVKQITPVIKRHLIDDVSVPQDQAFYRTTDITDFVYGGAQNQNHMIEVDFLHSLGFRGQGITIAVLDGGFEGVNTGAGFESVRAKEQIKGTYNFPDDTDFVYFSSTHGSNVLSIMAVDEPGVYVGSAPDADYYLIRTEVTDSEHVVEEDYWLEGAEYADIIGADVINSSLGYTTFDDTTEDHTYLDMDGNTTVATIAADMAAAAGILVVNSAGNSGDEPWHFIGAPADGDSVFTIGAVDLNGNYAGFSSVGPTVDGRIKPNVVGQGAGTAVMSAEGIVGYGNGTSYSSPLIAGACASFMSAFPDLSNMDVINIIQQTATNAETPNNQIGYGIPQFGHAYMALKGITLNDDILHVYPNPVSDVLVVYIQGFEADQAQFDMFDMAGKMIMSTDLLIDAGKMSGIRIEDLDRLASGLYTIRLTGDIYSESKLIYIQ